MAYLKCLDYCGKQPSLDVPWPDSSINWLGESTADQERIEAVLDGRVDEDTLILHVGIGNSSLAQRFAPQCRWIDGITLGAREYEHAKKIELVNYKAYRFNKYSPFFLSRINWAPYDFIVDNNLVSYACCVNHFNHMMNMYIKILKPDGMILTDRAGLAHAPGDKNWNLTDDIKDIASRFGLRLTEETEMVLALRK